MRVAVITGATAGFGAATARRFASNGWRLVVTGRRQERLDALVEEFGGPEMVHALPMDMRDREAVEKGLGKLPAPFDAVEVLVNNAGVGYGLEPIQEGNVDEWEATIDTNLKGVLYATRTLLPGMIERKRGHVINLGSTAGSWPYTGGTIYGASKSFIQHFSRGLRADLAGHAVRVTNMDPGLCETEFSVNRFRGDVERANSLYEGNDPIISEDIAEAIWWVVNMPYRVNVNTMELMPLSQSWSPLQVKPVDWPEGCDPDSSPERDDR
ncbi:NADP-dependent 3-hydroxy acid dehydrogenase YdfG [Natronocella acetinitrilica]|uniref:NADP-dependent 3-hydroxy acid dehydrogenase YdfG n=1 Tax=Natronocella acetinitrilica TaxID=414046 RepID=A0AAE3KDM7_9GAMM|nr:SDR family NAD(P)-dependent oxidoreductase [Natronocella acetinitrilica]MCP1677031.1 NADP-dependent 3-hydroxy acid dehydrogenase YdfG [Natronocella acetinitrilica]